jgi:hypothetical protein
LNDELRKLHNDKRLLHESPPLQYDGDLAKKLQSELDKKSVGFTASTVLDLGDSYKIETLCGRNVFEHKDTTSTDIKAVSKAAAADWYSGNTVYDYKTGDMVKFDATSQ